MQEVVVSMEQEDKCGDMLHIISIYSNNTKYIRYIIRIYDLYTFSVPVFITLPQPTLLLLPACLFTSFNWLCRSSSTADCACFKIVLIHGRSTLVVQPCKPSSCCPFCWQKVGLHCICKCITLHFKRTSSRCICSPTAQMVMHHQVQHHNGTLPPMKPERSMFLLTERVLYDKGSDIAC